MPDKRLHRGPHPEDPRLFAPDRWRDLRGATHDLSWLLTHDYALNSSLKLVGDRYQLTERQRLAVMRSSCSDQSLQLRKAHELSVEQVGGIRLAIDGYNLLTTIEAALGGGVILLGRDGGYRDMASMHGHYKRVLETEPALTLIGETLVELGVAGAHFYLDAPVSNSGRLKTMMRELAAGKGWAWEITLLNDPDPALSKSGEVIVTADSIVLDGARNPKGHAPPRSFNLPAHVLGKVPTAQVVRMWGAAD